MRKHGNRPKPVATVATGRRAFALAAAALLGLIALAYGRAHAGDWVWDDRAYVRDSPAVASVAGALRGFTTDANQGANARSARSDLYRPLAFASYWLNAALGGLTPASLHLGNLLLHQLSALLLLAFLVGRLPEREPGLLAAWAGAALWALHPEQVEAVAWISGRYDLLGVCLGLAALLLQDRDGPAARAAQALLLLGAALSKETYLLMAAVLVADDAGQGRLRTRARAYALYAGALGVWAALRAAAVGAPGAGALPGPGAFAADLVSSAALYVGRAVAPLPLSLHHGYAPLPLPALAAAALGLGLATWLAVRHPRWLGPLAAYLLLLAPEAVAVGTSRSAAERYFLGPSLGLAWGLALALAAALRAWPGRTRLAGAACATLAAACATLVAARVPAWRSEEAIFAAVLEAQPDDWFGLYQVGRVRGRAGAVAEAASLLERALAQAGAQRVPPEDLGLVAANLAYARLLQKDARGARAAAEAAVRYYPRSPHVRLIAARAYDANREPASAVRELDAALSLSPDLHQARGMRALARAALGDRAGARSDLSYLAEFGSGAEPEWAEVAASAQALLGASF